MSTSDHPFIVRTRRIDGVVRFSLRCAAASLVIGAVPVVGFIGIAVAQSGAFVAMVAVVLAIVYDDGLLEPFAGFWGCQLTTVAICVWQFVFVTWQGIHLLGILGR